MAYLEPDSMREAYDSEYEKLKQDFGRNLARIRKAAGYSQLALAVELNMTHTFINALEHGAKGASFETVAKLAVVLRTSVQSFFEPQPKEDKTNNGGRYPDPIDNLVSNLKDAISTWNDSRSRRQY